MPSTDLYASIREVLVSARTRVQQNINEAMVQAYWQVGRLIVEDEQGDATRADYGKKVLEALSERLSEEFSKGFDIRSLRNMRSFYLAYPIRCALL
jgi:hypothetical protein